MRLTSLLANGLILAAFSTSLSVYAGAAPQSAKQPAAAPETANQPDEDKPAKEIVIEENNVYVPIKDSPIQAQDKGFAFDWNQYATIATNKNKIPDIEAFLQTLNVDDKLTKEDQQALGELLYKLGTYYTHVTRQSDMAITRMNQADALLLSPDDKAWNYNHLAYAYEQKYAATGELSDKRTALDYANKVITDTYHNAPNKSVAFAFCVKGLVQNDAKDYAQAESSFNYALRIYESLPDGKDDQYARAKNRLADIILDENDNDQKAVTMLEQLNQHWKAKKDYLQNPYAARNFLSLGRAYLKIKKADAAKDNLKVAIDIYSELYGHNSGLLAEPYQLLGEVYYQLGDEKRALVYTQRAKSLLNAIENG